MLAYIQAPNMYFDITAYIHAKGMYYCVSRYLYMGYEVLEYVPGSPITRYVRYPDSLVPNTYATPPVTGYLERPLPGMPITQYILAPGDFTDWKKPGCLETNWTWIIYVCR